MPLIISNTVAAKKPTALGSDRLISRHGFPTMIAPAQQPAQQWGPPPAGGDQRARDERARDEQAGDSDANFTVDAKREQFRAIGQGIDERGTQRDLGEGR